MTIIPGNYLADNDSNFETSIGNWGARNANSTVARDTAQSFDGVASMKLTSVAAGNTGAIISGAPSPAALNPTRTYRYYFNVYTTVAGALVRGDIDWYFTGAYQSSASVPDIAVTPGQWNLISFDGTTPGSCDGAVLIVTATATGAAQDYWIDQVYFGAPEPVTAVYIGPAPGRISPTGQRRGWFGAVDGPLVTQFTAVLASPIAQLGRIELGASGLTPPTPNFGGSAVALAGGTGIWINPGSAAGGDDNIYATWAVP